MMSILIDLAPIPGESEKAYMKRVDEAARSGCMEFVKDRRARAARAPLERVRTPEGCAGKITIISNYEPTEADRAFHEMLNGAAAASCADEKLWD